MASVSDQTKTPRLPARWHADLVLALVALIWGSTFVVVKVALLQISTMYFLTLRFSLATLCLFLLFGRALVTMDRKSLLRSCAGGFCAGAFLWLGYLLQSFGLKYTTAANSGFLTGFYIVLVPVLSAALFRRWPRKAEVLGLLLAVSGMVVLSLPEIQTQSKINFGDLLTIGCAIAFSLHLLVLGFFSQRERIEGVALGQIACTACLSAACLRIEPPHVLWSGALAAAIVITGIFATAIAFALQTWGQRHTTATRTALLFSLEPVFALVTAALFGNEPLTRYSVGGGGLVLGGILFVEIWPQMRASADMSP